MAQAIIIKDAVFINNDRIIKASALGEISFPEMLEFLHEAKGAGATYFLNEGG